MARLFKNIKKHNMVVHYQLSNCSQFAEKELDRYIVMYQHSSIIGQYYVRALMKFKNKSFVEAMAALDRRRRNYYD